MGADSDRPTYSKDYLEQLKGSTPSTPKPAVDIEDESIKGVNLASKFGEQTNGQLLSAIPTEAEIRERKDRRARLAKEMANEEFIGLDASDEESDRNEISLRPREKYPETRLVREDEDLGEGFDDFVQDSRIALGRKAAKEQERKRRAEMESMIDEAEGGTSDSLEDSEAERKAAYDAAQTKKGTYASGQRAGEIERPRTPSKITPIPDLSSVLARLQHALNAMEESKRIKDRRLEDLRQQRVDDAKEKERIQELLKGTAERYEKMREEAGIGAQATVEAGTQSDRLMLDRGLENFGATQIAQGSDSSDG